jgi:chromosomal replication initiator protein
MNQILKTVCTYYSVKAVDIKGTKRTKDLVFPRQVTMYLIHNITKTPLMTIGDFLGGRDHTTVLHGTQKIEREIQEDRLLKQEIETVKRKVYED